MDLERIFESIDLGAVEGYICDGRQEDLFLEFKTVAGAELRGGDDQRKLAKVLSGFANASGGIGLWGVADFHEDTGLWSALPWTILNRL